MYALYLNGARVAVLGNLQDACLEGQRILTGEGVLPFCAILIVNERNVVERVLVDDANGLVYHTPEKGATE